LRSATSCRGSTGSPRAPEGSPDTACNCARSRRSSALTGLLERQFRNYFEKGRGVAKGPTGEKPHHHGSSGRLDNVVWRAGLAVFAFAGAAARAARAHVRVNGKKVNIPSYLVNVGEEVAIKEKMHQNTPWSLEARNVRAKPERCALARAGARTVQGQGRSDAEARWTCRRRRSTSNLSSSCTRSKIFQRRGQRQRTRRTGHGIWFLGPDFRAGRKEHDVEGFSKAEASCVRAGNRSPRSTGRFFPRSLLSAAGARR